MVQVDRDTFYRLVDEWARKDKDILLKRLHLKDQYNTGKFPAYQCDFCGRPEIAYYTPGIAKRMVDSQLCFECLYWTDIAAKQYEYILIDGSCYKPCSEDASGLRGMGGILKTIQLEDGSIIRSTNLWVQGLVPERFIPAFSRRGSFI